MSKWDISNVDEDFQVHKARILVVGAGGGGSNTISTITEMGIAGASTVAVNTDARHLVGIKADRKVLIGRNLTRGLGAGGYPDTGRNAALESKEELRNVLAGTDLVFLTCGLGGRHRHRLVACYSWAGKTARSHINCCCHAAIPAGRRACGQSRRRACGSSPEL